LLFVFEHSQLLHECFDFRCFLPRTNTLENVSDGFWGFFAFLVDVVDFVLLVVFFGFFIGFIGFFLFEDFFVIFAQFRF